MWALHAVTYGIVEMIEQIKRESRLGRSKMREKARTLFGKPVIEDHSMVVERPVGLRKRSLKERLWNSPWRPWQGWETEYETVPDPRILHQEHAVVGHPETLDRLIKHKEIVWYDK